MQRLFPHSPPGGSVPAPGPGPSAPRSLEAGLVSRLGGEGALCSAGPSGLLSGAFVSLPYSSERFIFIPSLWPRECTFLTPHTWPHSCRSFLGLGLFKSICSVPMRGLSRQRWQCLGTWDGAHRAC